MSPLDGSTVIRWCSGPGRQPVSSSISRAAAAAMSSPSSTTPAASSQPQLSVMKRCRHSSRTSLASLTTVADGDGPQPDQEVVQVPAVGEFHIGQIDA